MTSGQHFGRLLRAWRTENQLTQRQVADMLSARYDKSQLVNLEQGKRKAVTVEEALLLCALMGKDLQDVVRPVPVPEVKPLHPDWLGQRVAVETAKPYSAILRRAMKLYGHDASTEHAIRCADAPDRGTRSFAVTRGNVTKGIRSELAA